MRDEVVESRAIRIGHGALFQHVVEIGDGSFLEDGRRRESDLEMAIDLLEDARQVPGGEIFPGRLGGGSAAHETPAVLLEVLPIPMRLNGFEQRNDFLWRLGDLGFEAGDFFLRFVALNVSFENNSPRDGLGRFAPRLVLQGVLDDRFQLFNGCLGQPLFDRFLDFLPLRLARGGEGKRAVDSHCDQDDSKDPFHNPHIVRLAG